MWVTKDAPFLYTKRGVYYFSRRVPEDLKDHYKSPRIAISLRTKSRKVARARAITLAAKLDEDWLTLRWKSASDPLRRFLNHRMPSETKIASEGITLSDAKELYLQAKKNGRSSTFTQAAERSVGYLVGCHGDKPIDAYTRSEVNQFRDALLDRGLTRASVRRTFNTIRAIVNFAARESGLPEVKAFSGVFIGDEDTVQTKKRASLPPEVVETVQQSCREIDDEPRWLVALISDTGMRLSEAVGLVKEDVVLDDEYPHVTVRPHPWRRLKTKGSERIIPLVGTSLWAAKRALEASNSLFLFPRYCSQDGHKANSASGALNKWLSPRVPTGCVVHSFRHSLRDRLRAVECPPDIIDRIGGWSVAGIGESYGRGYPLPVLSKWMASMVAGLGGD
ncbi:tyrosine-type recombinase/integrase [Nitratireductor aquimarinus]|uniref:DUF6538 domain-containing protein n=1 Tax=Alphaproteobacteria TaxID=28211 RepID=UPI0019D3A526|nr:MULTISPECIES: DUF6538 domain-containing protein [Alphaproteobacteria]MBN7757348.1 tyrosine-type recombinase/integrase [Nitratireductor aquimarinus]MBY6000108.1 tyrosine-type recombinase/integrase [Tritonibacter mobilis]MBY6022136.1 tyrosine-type recombinase/integrase [Nitratireductor sp. DP7N14-4]